MLCPCVSSQTICTAEHKFIVFCSALYRDVILDIHSMHYSCSPMYTYCQAILYAEIPNKLPSLICILSLAVRDTSNVIWFIGSTLFLFFYCIARATHVLTFCTWILRAFSHFKFWTHWLMYFCNLTMPAFSHGQLYVTLSQIRNCNNACVLLQNRDGITMNVTFEELLLPY
jgi:hypothetical protein